MPRIFSGEVVSLSLKPQACARQINNPHQALPQATQTSEDRQAEEGWGTYWEFDTLQDALHLRVEEMRSRHLKSCLFFFKHDLMLQQSSSSLIRCFLFKPDGPQISLSKKGCVDVKNQSSTMWKIMRGREWNQYFINFILSCAHYVPLSIHIMETRIWNADIQKFEFCFSFLSFFFSLLFKSLSPIASLQNWCILWYFS